LLVPKKKEQPPSSKSYFIVKLLAGVGDGDPQPMCSPKRTANQVHCEKSTQIEMKTIGRGADVLETLRKQNTLWETRVRIFCSFVNDACARFLYAHTPGNFHRRRIKLGRRDVCTKKRQKLASSKFPEKDRSEKSFSSA
jgi:hypothetical protein